MNSFWIALLVSSVTAYPIFQLLLRMNSRQKVSEFAPATHQAKQGTPTMGGLIFVIPFLVLVPLIALQTRTETTIQMPDLLGSPVVGGRNLNPGFAAVTILFALFAVIGFIDDFVVPRMMPGKRGLGWKQKIVMQFVAAGLFAWMRRDTGWQIAVDEIAILACANAYNFADGLDGLAASIGLLIIPGLIGISAILQDFAMIQMLAVLAGAILPFAFLNAPKAKVFMGDVGSLPFGALIGAAVAIQIDPWPSWSILIGLKVLALMLVVELIPVPLQIFWVKVFKRKLFPFTPIHHAFEKAGWPETRVVAMFALGQLLCTMAALTIWGYQLPNFGWGAK